MFTSMPLSMLMVVAMQIAAQAQPPKILQVFREPLKPRVEAEYDRIESSCEIAVGVEIVLFSEASSPGSM